MAKTFLTAILALFSTCLAAQESLVPDIRLEARVDYVAQELEASQTGTDRHFKGKNFNLIINGGLGAGFSYSLRQRLNRVNKSDNLFSATDWLELSYSTKNWTFAAGKQVVCVGGYEYDISPIDVCYYSEYINNVACYQFGTSGSYRTDSGKDRLTFQISQSLFQSGDSKGLFAYNLMWNGNHGFFESIWSVNMIEHRPGRFMNFIALGSRFTFGNFLLEADLTNRAASFESLPLKDITLLGKAQWTLVRSLNLFVKCSWDRNASEEEGDQCVLPGTDIARFGGGLEFFPLRNSRNVRLHLNYCRTKGVNTSPWAVLQDGQNILSAGLTWRMDILKKKEI